MQINSYYGQIYCWCVYIGGHYKMFLFLPKTIQHTQHNSNEEKYCIYGSVPHLLTSHVYNRLMFIHIPIGIYFCSQHNIR